MVIYLGGMDKELMTGLEAIGETGISSALFDLF